MLFSGLAGSLAGGQIGGWSWCVFCTMWQAKLANSTCLASLDYAWKPSWISAELSPFLFKMVFWYLSKWRHGIIILAVKKLGLKIHFYEKWGYLFLPTNMTISWGHGLWTPNESFFQISQIFWPIGYLDQPNDLWGIRMTHWCHTMVDGDEFWISCQWLTFLSILSHWQPIQNSAPSTMVWRQCDIQILGYFW